MSSTKLCSVPKFFTKVDTKLGQLQNFRPHLHKLCRTSNLGTFKKENGTKYPNYNKFCGKNKNCSFIHNLIL
jgi:hypothetical protein